MNREGVLYKINNVFVPLALLAFWAVSFLFFSALPRRIMIDLLDSPGTLIISALVCARTLISFIFYLFRQKPDVSRYDADQLVQYSTGQTMMYTGSVLAVISLVSLALPLNEIVRHSGSFFLWQALASFLSLSKNALNVITGAASGVVSDISEWLFGKPPATPSQEDFLKNIKDPATQSKYRDLLKTWHNQFSYKSSFMVWCVEKSIDSGSYFGSIMRTLYPEIDIIKEEGPLTQAFFKRTDSFTGSETDIIRQTYEAISKSLRFVPSGTESNHRDSEYVLSHGEGVCREQAALLNTALQRHGIDSEIVSMSPIFDSKGNTVKEGHTWVEVDSKEYGRIWLDTLNVKDFLPIVPSK